MDEYLGVGLITGDRIDPNQSDILTCQSRKIPGGVSIMNYGNVPFS